MARGEKKSYKKKSRGRRGTAVTSMISARASRVSPPLRDGQVTPPPPPAERAAPAESGPDRPAPAQLQEPMTPRTAPRAVPRAVSGAVPRAEPRAGPSWVPDPVTPPRAAPRVPRAEPRPGPSWVPDPVTPPRAVLRTEPFRMPVMTGTGLRPITLCQAPSDLICIPRGSWAKQQQQQHQQEQAQADPRLLTTSTPRRNDFTFEDIVVSPIKETDWQPKMPPKRAAAEETLPNAMEEENLPNAVAEETVPTLPVFTQKQYKEDVAAGTFIKYKPMPPPEGRRCILYQEFIEQILADKHAGGYCNFFNSVFVGETILGFRSLMYYQCEMCLKITLLRTDGAKPKQDMNINMSMVSGAVEAGITHAALQTVAAAINMPAPTQKTYAKYEDRLADKIEAEALKEMLKWGAVAKAHAEEVGNVINGVPWITCILDGQWSKRVFKCKYDATSGSVTVIDKHTGKVIWQATKNKRCSLCEVAARKNIPVRAHKCGRNYKGPSTGMEAALAVEAFKSSMEMHGVMILKYIGDGDSSVEARLQAAAPYGPLHLIQKVECKNHILRNFKRALIDISTSAQPCPEGVSQQEMSFLKKNLRENVLRISTGVSKACEYRGEIEKGLSHHLSVLNLRQDILNAASHIFGEHRKCALYFCKTRQAAEAAAAEAAAAEAAAAEAAATAPASAPAPAGPAPSTSTNAPEPEENLVKRLEKAGLWSKIMSHLNRVAEHSSSLVFNVTNNPCEVANSVIAQRACNKRPYLGGRRSYEARVNSAGLSLNTSGQGLGVVHTSIAGTSPGIYTDKYMVARKAKRDKKRLWLAKKKMDLIKGVVRPTPRPAATGPDEHYGLQEKGNQPPPAVAPAVMKAECDKFLQWLHDNLLAHQAELRAPGVDQTSNVWKQARKIRLTAVDFGEVCKRRPWTSCKRFVWDKLYRKKSEYVMDKPTPVQMEHGTDHEPLAKARLAGMGYVIQECTLFIDTEMPFLGASPDGLLANDFVLEIKCPYTAYESESLEAAIQSEQIQYLTKDEHGKIKLRTDNKYYYQIQGQLHITKRLRCLFMVYAKSWEHIEEIEKNDDFWNNEMRDKLERFYKEALLPEIVLPVYHHRFSKEDIREAESVTEVLQTREREKKEKEQKAAQREEEKRKKKEEKEEEKRRKEEAAEKKREALEKKRQEAEERKRKAAEKKEEQAKKRRSGGEDEDGPPQRKRSRT